jgi:hypothetical protein
MAFVKIADKTKTKAVRVKTANMTLASAVMNVRTTPAYAQQSARTAKKTPAYAAIQTAITAKVN